MKKRSIVDVFFIVIFVLLCCSWIIWQALLVVYLNVNNIENRDLYTKPQFTLNKYETYAKDYESYVNDNIPLRYRLITINSILDYHLFNRSANSKVIKGKDEWLFYIDTLNDYQKYNLYSEEELATISEEVIRTKEYFDKKNINFIIFIGPNKNTIYSEKMPEYIDATSSESRAYQVVEYLKEHTDVKVVFPVDVLLEAKDSNPELQYYFKTDTHWNYMGGYFSTIPMLNELNADVIDFDELRYEEVNKPVFEKDGYDLTNMLGLSTVHKTDVNYEVHSELLDSIIYTGDDGSTTSYFNNIVRTSSVASDTRKVFFARDSYGKAITPYIASAFSEVVSVYYGNVSLEMIDEEKPDVFIFEMVERKDFIGAFDYLNWEK